MTTSIGYQGGRAKMQWDIGVLHGARAGRLTVHRMPDDDVPSAHLLALGEWVLVWHPVRGQAAIVGFDYPSLEAAQRSGEWEFRRRESEAYET